MIKITKDERNFLVNECGFKPGKHISRTYTHHPHYYAAEYVKVMKKLEEFRRNRIVK